MKRIMIIFIDSNNKIIPGYKVKVYIEGIKAPIPKTIVDKNNIQEKLLYIKYVQDILVNVEYDDKYIEEGSSLNYIYDSIMGIDTEFGPMKYMNSCVEKYRTVNYHEKQHYHKKSDIMKHEYFQRLTKELELDPNEWYTYTEERKSEYTVDELHSNIENGISVSVWLFKN